MLTSSDKLGSLPPLSSTSLNRFRINNPGVTVTAMRMDRRSQSSSPSIQASNVQVTQSEGEGQRTRVSFESERSLPNISSVGNCECVVCRARSYPLHGMQWFLAPGQHDKHKATKDTRILRLLDLTGTAQSRRQAHERNRHSRVS